jgi:hypothetical protein
VPDSVKFDAEGFIVSTQVASGQVLRIDPRTGNNGDGSAEPDWTTAPSSTDGSSSRTSPARSPEIVRVGATAPRCPVRSTGR